MKLEHKEKLQIRKQRCNKEELPEYEKKLPSFNAKFVISYHHDNFLTMIKTFR